MAAKEKAVKKDKATKKHGDSGSAGDKAEKKRSNAEAIGTDTKPEKSKRSKRDEIIEKKNRHARRPEETDGEATGAGQGDQAPVMAADGLERFPDYSQEHKVSQEAAAQAAQMGVPAWLAHPTVVDRDGTAQISDARFGLSAHMLGRCAKAGVETLFAVQAAVIPVLRAAQALTRLRQHVRDVCVSAPTGSGKTLAYVVPIVERLRPRVEVRLRALVVLPTKELARQVREAFQFFSSGTDLRVGLAVGDVSLAREQAALVGAGPPRAGGASRVDVLVCTPGRLVDHVTQTHNFTLQHLEFWVMDEADRLLGDANHEWLARIRAAVEVPVHPHGAAAGAVPVPDACTRHGGDGDGVLARPAPRIQKLLFSATLTQDPAKLAQLRLARPLYIAVAGADRAAYAFPATLDEFYATCPADDKPLWLLGLLWQQQLRGAVCFVRSLEAAHRLAQVVQAWAAAVPEDAWPGARVVVAEYSSDQPTAERARVLRRFRDGDISLLVCSDLLARGLDIDQVAAVINYDVPTHMAQYTHRVGRTARAGRDGAAYTLVARPQMFHFKQMMKDHGHWSGALKLLTLNRDVLDSLRPQCAVALENVGQIYA
ncbi:ATP-dependent RNA helicase dbp6 [Coemansia sp. RSA 2711]|nr:ATP-dependent RNA helicase dbp6 [Coemansia sp. RSA 2711]KAJ2305281.1 ATP-dependent RNA helicase dbp6 [Coemansia sp. RSA 2705]KAJ2312398.1 ATP-dependent RNA helicase dbp6 [Coemansia sp. RSA 2704]KAJ2719365.1 ATP-dependent RNA helicase dbp6 [Coemansia sp. Cherry 401B]